MARRLAVPALLALLLGLGSTRAALAQDGQGRHDRRLAGHCATCGAPDPAPRCPTCGQAIHTPRPVDPEDERIDKKMRESLRREYDEPGEDTPPDDDGDGEKKKKKKHHRKWKVTTDESPGVKLKLMAGHWSVGVFGVRVASMKNGLGTGSAVRVDRDVAPDLDRSESQLYRGAFDFADVIGIEGSYRSTLNRDHGTVRTPFDFDGWQFPRGSLLATKLDTRVADGDLVVHAVNARHATLDFHFGFRYVLFDTSFQDDQGLGVKAHQRHEGFMPMIGARFAVRPAKWFELFARGRVGGMEWTTHEYRGRRSSSSFSSVRTRRTLRSEYSLDSEAGVKLMIGEVAGVILGYRFEWIGLLYERDSVQRKRTEMKQEGPFVLGVIEF